MYYIMNIAMISHFFYITIISGRSLFCYSIITIRLILIVSSRLCLIIRWISIRNMLSTILPIMILFSFNKMMCLWNYYICDNWWKTCTDFWRSTNNSNLLIFNSWFISILVNIFGRVWCTGKLTFLLLLNLDILKHNFLNLQWNKKHN